MTIARVMWLLPMCFLLHDGEEILTWGWWMRRNGEHVFDFGRQGTTWVSQSTGQMTVAVSVVGLVLLAATTADVLGLGAGRTPYLFAACLGLWLGHSFIHVGASLYHRMYTPGVVTAVLLCIPYGLYAYSRLFDAGLLTWQGAVVCGVAGLAAGPLLLRVAHGAGRRFAA